MNNTLYFSEREKDSFERHCRLSQSLEGKAPKIFDVGANAGQSILRYRDALRGCSITSFEPNPEIFTKLESDWGNTSGVTLERLALANHIGHLPFCATRVSECSSLLQPTDRMMELSPEKKYDYETINVSTMTLDNYCKDNSVDNIDILKIDVQGSEIGVLHGSEKMLKEGNVKIVYTEVTFAETYKNQTCFVDLVSYLSKFNYEIWDIGSFLYTRNGRLWAINLTMLHASASSFIESKNQQKGGG